MGAGARGETYTHLVHVERRGLITNGAADGGASENDHWLTLSPAPVSSDLIVG